MNIKHIAHVSFATLLLSFITSLSAANWVRQIRSNSFDDKLQIVIDLEKDPEFKVFVLSNPIRLVVDVQGRPAVDFSNQLSFRNRGVSKVRTGMNKTDKVRVVLDLIKDFRWKAYEMLPDSVHGHRVVVEVFDYPKYWAPHITKSTNTPPKLTAIKTGINLSNQQLILESAETKIEDKPITTTIKQTAFKPTIREATEVLGLSGNETPSIPGPEDPTKTTSVSLKNAPISTSVQLTALKEKPSNNLFDDPNFKVKQEKKPTALITPPPKKLTPSPANSPSSNQHKRELVIMIDPGHGGKDTGAIGKAGTQEKSIVLQIAKRLKKQIDNRQGMRAILTRTTDKYITLRGRLALANKHKPDLFVSIHADAALNRSAKGSSVFILSNSGASSKTAKWIAQRENAVDSKYGSDLNDFSSDVSNVLLGMQQDITIESSHQLANKTLRRLKGIGKVHKRRVERAGFAVLKYPSIPSMLVETAFISNPEEEKKLNSIKYQNKIAKAIATGIEEFFKTQGKL